MDYNFIPVLAEYLKEEVVYEKWVFYLLVSSLFINFMFMLYYSGKRNVEKIIIKDWKKGKNSNVGLIIYRERDKDTTIEKVAELEPINS